MAARQLHTATPRVSCERAGGCGGNAGVRGTGRRPERARPGLSFRIPSGRYARPACSRPRCIAEAGDLPASANYRYDKRGVGTWVVQHDHTVCVYWAYTVRPLGDGCTARVWKPPLESRARAERNNWLSRGVWGGGRRESDMDLSSAAASVSPSQPPSAAPTQAPSAAASLDPQHGHRFLRSSCHFVNLTNGLEALPALHALQLPYSFVRVQSTACEQHNFEQIILALDSTLLMHLALGACALTSFGGEEEAPSCTRAHPMHRHTAQLTSSALVALHAPVPITTHHQLACDSRLPPPRQQALQPSCTPRRSEGRLRSYPHVRGPCHGLETFLQTPHYRPAPSLAKSHASAN
jgi:hypothetical protein